MKFENNLTATNKKAYTKSKEQYELAKSQLAENEMIQANNRKELEKIRRTYSVFTTHANSMD